MYYSLLWQDCSNIGAKVSKPINTINSRFGSSGSREWLVHLEPGITPQAYKWSSRLNFLLFICRFLIQPHTMRSVYTIDIYMLYPYLWYISTYLRHIEAFWCKEWCAYGISPTRFWWQRVNPINFKNFGEISVSSLTVLRCRINIELTFPSA